MALTGYVFHGPQDIRPFAEQPRTGPTSVFIAELATRLRCHVIAGYPEALPDEEDIDSRYGAYNSAIICGPGGEYIGGGRKTNMFTADLPWCKPGNGFTHCELPSSPLQIIAFGICMDLNPHPPNTDDDLSPVYELAEFALQKNARILVVLCAWLNSGDSPDSQWDMVNINYWVERVKPLWERPGTSVDHVGASPHHFALDAGTTSKVEDRETIVVVCNRTGIERGTTFGGCSLVLKCNPRMENPEILGVLSRTFEGVRVWDIE